MKEPTRLFGRVGMFLLDCTMRFVKKEGGPVYCYAAARTARALTVAAARGEPPRLPERIIAGI